MINHLFFFVGLSFLLTHELDAVRAREWTIFPGLARLDDTAGYWVFTALHVPLYLLLWWALYGAGELNQEMVTALDLFFMIHVGLHLLALRHPNNRFTSPFSWLWIGGAGLAGLLDLLV